MVIRVPVDDNRPIEIIFISPKNRQYCEYTVNDGSTHIKKYEELEEYLSDLYPNLKQQIGNMLSLRKFFFILPKENLIEELKFDLEKELNLLKLENKKLDIKKIYPNYIINEKSKKSLDFKLSDSIVKKISELK